VQARLHGARRDGEDRRHVRAREVQLVAQGQQQALLHGQPGHRGRELGLQLPLHHLLLGVGAAAGGLEVAQRLEPAPVAHDVQGAVHGDAADPGQEGALGIVGVQVLPGRDERLLHHVGGQVVIVDDPAHGGAHRSRMPFDQPLVGAGSAGKGGGNVAGVVARGARHRPTSPSRSRGHRSA